jgi:hypothetical protein
MTHCGNPIEIQSIVFARVKWTEAKAKAWLRRHGYRTPTPDRGPNYLHFRQHPPGRFRFIRYGAWGPRASGIRVKYGCPKA